MKPFRSKPESGLLDKLLIQGFFANGYVSVGDIGEKEDYQIILECLRKNE